MKTSQITVDFYLNEGIIIGLLIQNTVLFYIAFNCYLEGISYHNN
jgi:hypothetical protein